MSWTYKQSTGRLEWPDGSVAAVGYAGGNCGKNPEGVNNTHLEHVRSVGPIPRGRYTFGEPLLKSHMGPYAIPLIPDKANQMHGRSAFYMHGDTTPSGNASEGCIIMPRAVREACWASGDHALEVV